MTQIHHQAHKSTSKWVNEWTSEPIDVNYWRVIFANEMSEEYESNSYEEDDEGILTVYDEDDVIKALIENTPVRFNGHILTPTQIDDWSIDYLVDIPQLPFE